MIEVSDTFWLYLLNARTCVLTCMCVVVYVCMYVVYEMYSPDVLLQARQVGTYVLSLPLTFHKASERMLSDKRLIYTMPWYVLYLDICCLVSLYTLCSPLQFFLTRFRH